MDDDVVTTASRPNGLDMHGLAPRFDDDEDEDREDLCMAGRGGGGQGGGDSSETLKIVLASVLSMLLTILGARVFGDRPVTEAEVKAIVATGAMTEDRVKAIVAESSPYVAERKTLLDGVQWLQGEVGAMRNEIAGMKVEQARVLLRLDAKTAAEEREGRR